MSYKNTHFAEIIYHQANKYKDRTELIFKDENNKWTNLSWIQFAEIVRITSQALIEFGIKVQENIGIYAPNMPESIFTCFGAFGVRAVEVPMYSTSSPGQIKYIVKDANIRLLFVGEQLQYNNAFKVQRELDGAIEKLVIFDRKVVKYPEDKSSVYFEEFIRLGDNAHSETEAKIRRNEAVKEDSAIIVYTSGTTGEPKGVVIIHENMLEAMRIHDIRLTMVKESDTSMCFLPLSHIFEKTWVCFCLHQGIKIAINQDPKEIQKALAEIRPTLMCNVPRFWEKVYAGVKEKIESAPGLLKKLMLNSVKTGHRYIFEYKNKEIAPPLGLNLKFHLYDRTIFALLKRVVGINKGHAFPIAGSPLSNEIAEFLLSVNIPVIYGYGLSETTATVCCYPVTHFVLGSIGKVMPDIEVKIDESNNEILVKGKTIMSGYYNKPEETAKVFTEDGFFRTGDAGSLEGDTLFFRERIKDLYKTSNGKYIAPQAIELTLVNNMYIEQGVAIADECKFVSALIVPNFQALTNYAVTHNIKFDDNNDLIQKDEIIRFYQSIIEECQKQFASFEKIKRFTLLAEPLSMAKGELTDTLKLRRPVIIKNYAEQIAEMYKE
jgi:long-chain acyl-CoA synthetase